MPLSSAEVIALLAKTDWTDVAPRVLAFANFTLATHHRGAKNAKDAHQYVMRAMFDIVSGRHVLHTPSILNALCGVVYANVKRDAARRAVPTPL